MKKIMVASIFALFLIFGISCVAAGDFNFNSGVHDYTLPGSGFGGGGYGHSHPYGGEGVHGNSTQHDYSLYGDVPPNNNIV